MKLVKFVNYQYAVCDSNKYPEIFSLVREFHEVMNMKELWESKVYPLDNNISYNAFVNWFNWLVTRNRQEEIRIKGDEVADEMSFMASEKVMERIRNMNPNELDAKDAINAVPKLAKVFQDSERIKMDRNEREKQKNASDKIIDMAQYGDVAEAEFEEIKKTDDGQHKRK